MAKPGGSFTRERSWAKVAVEKSRRSARMVFMGNWAPACAGATNREPSHFTATRKSMSQAELFDAPDELPSGLVYQPAFLSAAEEAALIEGIASLDLKEA